MITKNQTLLEKAKSIAIKRNKPSIEFTQEDVDLVTAFLKEDIVMKQLQKVKGFSSEYQCLMYIINVIKSTI